ncbi:species-specific tRNA processing [Trebouxia sp. C0009 RCD-2024]
MAGGMVVTDVGGRSSEYNGKVTWYVVLVSLIAASGGLLFGYDLGVTGGVESFPEFQNKFFPEVAAAQAADRTVDPYCSYDSQKLSAFTSVLFLAGAFFSLFATPVTRIGGRKLVMILGGGAFCIGAILCAFAQDLAMLIIGRVCLGAGVGFANQAVPLYLSEIAPAHARGTLNIMFQMATTIGIWVAQWINYGTKDMHPNGWRLSVGLAIVPALILFLGSLIIPDTPNSLVYRGKVEQARRVLERVRGTPNVDAEFADIVEAVENGKKVNKFAIFQRKYRPVLTGSILIPFFQQFTGINTIMFYATQLFAVLGQDAKASLLSTAIVGAVNVGSTIIAIILVDRVGRKVLFAEGGLQMFICFIVVAGVMGGSFNKSTGFIPQHSASAILAFECLFTAGFAWSWGPLGWLVPSEFHNIETRGVGQSITVCVNFLFSFVIGQTYLTMLCRMEFGTYIFFAFWVFVMTCYVLFFLPETKGVPIEEMGILWRKHWFWSKVIMNSEERAAFQKGDLLSAGVTTGAEVPATALGKGGMTVAGQDPMAKDLRQF